MSGELTGREIAVVGMAGRFPGAADPAALWRRTAAGEGAIHTFTVDELRAVGVPSEILADPRYVRARGILEGADLFDAPLFGFTPREAELLDPQHRVFLECAWTALEDAGVDPATASGLIAVYAGVGLGTYAWNVLSRRGELDLQAVFGNDKDFLATQVSYRLNLRGPSLTVQTACSTSLVAVHLACQALLNYECDLALAGGVTIAVPQERGYPYREGGILSPDGCCRAFDARAAGTVPGSGAGVAILARLEDALADGRTVLAVVRGSAINNDGAFKVGYTAPSIEGQAEVIAAAQAMAGVDPAAITYVETHGTGTALGDPIEIAALIQAFRANGETGTGGTGYCALGALKPNIGHCDTAAGIAGFLRTVLALRHRRLPPTLHFERLHPEVDLAGTPFYISTGADWETDRLPRRAGVSSFGIGGTNAHVILEEAPEPEPSGPSRPFQLLLLSARTPEALEKRAADLASYLREHPEIDPAAFADVAHTLRVGRRTLPERRALVVRRRAEALRALAAPGDETIPDFKGRAPARPPAVVFLLPGQGTQYPGMAAELWRNEPVFHAAIDECADLLAPHLAIDLRCLLWPAAGEEATAAERLARTEFTQPALFAVEWAMARLWREWGIVPEALLGHSLGEITAACLAGVFPLADALTFTALRGRLLQALPSGAMLAVPLPESGIAPYLSEDLSLAVVNAPDACTVSGPEAAVESLSAHLAARGVHTRRLHTSHAFHSAMVDPVVEPLARHLRNVPLAPPAIPFLSNVTGTWITAEQATDPDYWALHVRRTVRFGAGCAALLADPDRLLLEVGPGDTLGQLARRQPTAAGRTLIASLPGPTHGASAQETALLALARLWVAGARFDPQGFAGEERRRTVPLPTYPFERRRYWAADEAEAQSVRPEQATGRAVGEGREEAPEGAAQGRTDLRLRRSSDLETTLAALIQQTLGVATVSPHDDFFDLGGSSLLALNLLAELEKTLGAAPPLSALARGRATPAELARHLRAQTPSEGAVELAEGDGTPLFWVHPIGGGILSYLPLARHLGRAHPIWAFPAPGLDSDRPPLHTVEELAAEHLAALRKVRPRGPYLLAGWSFGGLVAWEIRRRLLAEGDEVPLLVLADSWPGALDLPLTPPPSLPEEAPEGPRMERISKLLAAHTAAAQAWRAAPPGGPTLLLLAGGEPGGPPRAAAVAAAWEQQGAAPLTVHTFDATHWTLLAEPCVREVAESLEEALATLEIPAKEKL
jgi:acyl transferase domain-containing protein/thioesterase domain-containing protein